MAIKDANSFVPFATFTDNRRATTKYLNASKIAFGIAVAVLSDNRFVVKECNPPIGRLPKAYTDADITYHEIRRLYGWVTPLEYAELSNLDAESVEKAVEDGLLGNVQRHPVTGGLLLFWPAEMRGSDEAAALEVGLSKWSVSISRDMRLEETIDIDPADQGSLSVALERLVSVGRAQGVAEDVYGDVEGLLFRSAFLNLWSAFEQFLKEAIIESIRIYPTLLTKVSDGNKASVSYEYLVAETNGFTDVERLRASLVGSEIARIENSKQGVHGFINLLKDMFRWKDDPYVRPYFADGKRCVTSFTDLLEIKEVRNDQVHNCTSIGSLSVKSERLQVRGGRVFIDDGYVGWAELVLTAIAHGIARDIASATAVPR